MWLSLKLPFQFSLSTILKPRSLYCLSSFHLPFIAQPLNELNYSLRVYTYFHIFRSTALTVLLISPPSQGSPILPITTIPLFPYRSLPLQPSRYILTFMSLFMSFPLHSCLLPVLFSIYSNIISSSVTGWLVPTSSAVTKLRMEQVLEKDLSFQLQPIP